MNTELTELQDVFSVPTWSSGRLEIEIVPPLPEGETVLVRYPDGTPMLSEHWELLP
jgi:hypothetical protein